MVFKLFRAGDQIGGMVSFYFFLLGGVTGFFVRDEMNMPTYLRIKMATVEHSILTRKKLDADLIAMLDPNFYKNRMQTRASQAMAAYELELERLKEEQRQEDRKRKE